MDLGSRRNGMYYECKACDYITNRKSNYNAHLLTGKHCELHLATSSPPSQEPEIKIPASGLMKYLITENSDFRHMILEVVKSNTDLQKQCMEFQKQTQDLQKQVLDVCTKIQPFTANHQNIHNQNSHNKTFNMQVFLNEHCKDAMNLNEFVDSIDLNLDDLESVGKNGFVDGIAAIINNKLRATEVHLRPIHCSDAKREVMYIKENNKWEKEGPKNENMRKFVQFIERKNIKLLGEYQEKYPESKDFESPLNDHYVHLSLTATSATTEHLDRVISKIAKEVLIEK